MPDPIVVSTEVITALYQATDGLTIDPRKWLEPENLAKLEETHMPLKKATEALDNFLSYTRTEEE